MEEIEEKLLEVLTEADATLSKEDFMAVAESVIEYIDQIARTKK